MRGSSHVKEHCHFTVFLAPNNQKQEEDFCAKRLDAAVRPIVSAAKDIFVYSGVDPNSPLLTSEEYASSLRKSRGKYELSPNVDLINELSELWVASGWARGSVVILIPVERFCPKQAFEGWGSIGTVGNFRVAHNSGAINFARKNSTEHNCIAICFPASNGIEWADIFAPKSVITRIWRDSCEVLPQAY